MYLYPKSRDWDTLCQCFLKKKCVSAWKLLNSALILRCVISFFRADSHFHIIHFPVEPLVYRLYRSLDCKTWRQHTRVNSLFLSLPLCSFFHPLSQPFSAQNYAKIQPVIRYDFSVCIILFLPGDILEYRLSSGSTRKIVIQNRFPTSFDQTFYLLSLP